MGGELTPFTVRVAEDALDDLRQRLARARWPEPATVADWSQGVPLDWLRDLCGYWQRGYDWRRLESRLNALPQFTTELDGLDLHFVHLRSPQPDALPLIVTHGWPGSVVEFLDVLEPLTDPVAHGGDVADAFHVVCPSLPGFGFSAKPAEPGWGPERIARAWSVLMGRLGYGRFGAQGGDWGAMVTTSLAAQDPGRLVGIHLNMLPVAGRDRLATQDLTDFERRSLADAAYHREWGSGYALEQATRPQTVGYGLVDSPVGQCAWIAEKYWAWTDHGGDPLSALSRDQMLDNISVYWHTATAASSARIYWEHGFARPSGRSTGPEPEPLVGPVGVSVFPREIFRPSRRWCERYCRDLRFYEQLPRGGHFAAFEQPELFVDQVRRAFRAMR
ncbi:epoxide hydrolase [Planosporangium thailandense]|uniref:Epoxide hydrolase n=1 Tax=Planosporangium thailandense TaxID=765197 RepID=A0ABX0XSW1_9ACTN|nr:epoxide hydrolase family protein [Planosporangium thailandense]NJC68318.1 epoxide hydrolase [Planosporangium thailandense]